MEGHQPGHDRRAALNFDIGRDSNVDCLVVGSEVLITISQMKARPELCTAMVQFPTVKINGIFGTFDYPPMSRGMLKKQKHRDALIAYVKSVLPDAHPLGPARDGASCRQERARCRTRSQHRAGRRCSPAAQSRLLQKGERERAAIVRASSEAQRTEHDVAVAALSARSA